MATMAPVQAIASPAQYVNSEALWLSEPLPLSELLRRDPLAGCLTVAAPLIEGARQRVRQGARALTESYFHVPFNPETIEATLARDLAEPLLMMIGRTMVLELNVARLEGLLKGDDPSKRFASFIGRLRT